MENSYLWGKFGDLRKLTARSTRGYRKAHPGEPLKLWYVPYKWIHGTHYLDQFDLDFAETFIQVIGLKDLIRRKPCPK